MLEDDFEELIRIASTPGGSKPLSEVEKFLLEHNFRESDTGVLSSDIYHAYKLWAVKPISKARFFEDFKTFYKPKTVVTGSGSRIGRRAVGYYVMWDNAEEEK